MDKYGMNGLLGVIRMENNDQTAVAIGNDLTNLGLSFHPTDEPLSRTFGSPWVETAKHKVEPEFNIPPCYDVPSAPPQQQKIQSLTEETLFYIFYTMPKDSMQEAAALELTNRNWRYHKELKLWLTKDPLTEPIQQTSQAERGIYVFFDPSTWEKVKKEYVLYYPDIA
jgi:CCR4-NOT transcription complex subunit 2